MKDVTEELFSRVPYSKASEELKNKVNSVLETEYSKLLQNGKNEIQALGEIMSLYGDLETVAFFAGIENDTLEEVLSPAGSMDKKVFKSNFTKARLCSVIVAWFIADIFVMMFQGMILVSPNYILGILFCAAALIPFVLLMRKKSAKMNYESVKLSIDAKSAFELYSDRYKKRTVNSLLLLTGLIANFVSLTFEHASLANMNFNELLVLINSNIYIPSIGILIFIKNVMYLNFLGKAVSDENRSALKKYISASSAVCGVFLLVSLTATRVLKRFVTNPFPAFYIATAVFIIIFAAVNYKKRVKLVIRNIRVNKTRIAAFSTAAIVFASVHHMRADTWILLPYITSISKVSHTEHDISYNEETGVYTISAGSDDFKILHLTDIHIGGSTFSSIKDYKALDACYKLIEYTHPDLVIVTGDMVFPLGIMSLSLNNQAPVTQFASFMRNVGIPWAFTYGNHDTESIATGSKEDIQELYKSLSYKRSGNLLYPCVQPDITGRNNQYIKLENPDGSIRQVLFLIDSNDYTGAGVNDYDYIHDDQVEWYARQVEKLNAEQNRIVPSMLFFHIPLQEYRTAYNIYQQGGDEVKYFFGKIGETMIKPICCSDYPSRLFDTAYKLGSTKAMFCGHDHYNNISMEYKGIRLTYGMSIDYLAMPGIDKFTEQRGGELITISSDSGFDIKQIKLTDIS